MTTTTCKTHLCQKCDERKPGDQFYWRDGRPRTEACKSCFPKPRRDILDRHAEALREKNETISRRASKARQPWTRADDEMLAAFWPDLTCSVEEIAETLGRSIWSVFNRASNQKLGDRRKLARKHHPID